jgi:hypothetical protein
MSDPAVPAPASAGFDTSAYPGDQKMNTWKSSSPYVFAGYYLTAPCHHSASWMGHRAALVAMGWNLLPVYVGQQVAGVSPCKSSILTGDQGQTDGGDAAAKMASEGFPSGSYVYLDIERTDHFPSGLADYITAWVSTIGGGDYLPGVYCHKFNATSVQTAVDAGLPDGVEVRYWIVGGVVSHFDIKTSKPTDVGVDFANIWQCPVSVMRAFGGVSINIDEDIADRPDPAGA